LDLGIDVLPFLLGDDEPWSRRFDEMNSDSGIRQWRTELRARHGVGEFGLDPASVPLAPALTRWLAQRQAADPGERGWARKPLDFTAYLAEKRQDFTGRQWLFDRIDAWRCRERERALLITGDP